MQSPYSLLSNAVLAEGAVCKGYGRGSKKLGFPTANLPQFHTDLEASSVNRGIYFGWCRIGQDSEVLPCVTNIGISPTFVGQENPVNIIESYVLHRPVEKGDFYGQHFRLALVAYIRPELKFAGLPELVAQIKSDVHIADQACRTLEREGAIKNDHMPVHMENKGLYHSFVLPYLEAGIGDLGGVLQKHKVGLNGSPERPVTSIDGRGHHDQNSVKISSCSVGGYKLFGKVDIPGLIKSAPIGQCTSSRF